MRKLGHVLFLGSLIFSLHAICILPVNSLCMAQELDGAANNWHQFRGPIGNGISTTARPPSEWNSTKNVVWKVKIPGSGTGSPIVWGDRVYVVTAVPVEKDGGAETPKPLTRQQITEKFDSDKNGRLEGEERSKAIEFFEEQRRLGIKPQQFTVLCLDREDGSEVWKQIAVETTPHDSHHEDHGYASASPITDGEHLFVNFGSEGVYCYDLEGQLIWKRDDLGQMQTRGSFGEGSSLALHADYLVLPWDHEGQSRIEVLNKATGKTVWKRDRDEPSNWLTPRVVVANSRPTVIQGGENFTRAYDLATGDELWKEPGLTSRPVASPVARDHLVVYASSRRGPAMAAFDLNDQGKKSWTINRQTPDCPSLALSENRIYFVSGNKAILSCADIETGKLLFEETRLNGLNGVYSSPVIADGKVFVTGRNGKTVVLRDGPEFSVLATNDIGEPVDATLALVGEQIFIRGREHLFCIQQ